MRVLAVTSEWPSPGLPHHGRFVQRQIEAVRALGVEVEVEAFRGGRDPRAYLAARRRALARLGGFDVLHAHFGQAALAVAGARAPTVVTFYGSDLEGIVGPSGGYTPRGAVLARLSRAAARRADEVVVVSASLGRRLPPGVSYEVIPTAVDAAVFVPGPRDAARRELGLAPDATLVLFAGRPQVPVKRFSLARRAAELAGPAVRLVTVEGLDPAGVAAHMRACDALLVTSRHEGSPTMVKEAVACGLPVVSVDVGDVRDTVAHLPGSVVVDGEDPREIAAALSSVLRADRPPAPPLPPELDQARQAERIVAVYRRALTRAG